MAKKNNKKTMKLIGMIAAFVVVALLSGLVGYGMGISADKLSGHTFYATIEDSHGDHLHAVGMDVNDINFRGSFNLYLSEDTIIEWHNTEKTMDDLKAGMNIAVTFEGAVQESAPASISHVSRIVILDDEL